MRGIIYALVFPNGKHYVGQTTNLRRRLESHRYKRKRTPVWFAIRKYGWQAVRVQVLACFITTRRDLFRLEARYIAEFKSLIGENGYNMSPGWTDNCADCSRDGCHAQAESLGLCKRHYRQEQHVRDAENARRRRRYLERRGEVKWTWRPQAERDAEREAKRKRKETRVAERQAKREARAAAEVARLQRRAERAAEREANAEAARNRRNAKRRADYRAKTAAHRNAKRKIIDAAVSQIADGRRLSAVAADNAVCEDTIRRWAAKAGIEVTVDHAQVAAELRAAQIKGVAARNAKRQPQREAVFSMRADGRTIPQIVKTTGIPRATVTRWCKAAHDA